MLLLYSALRLTRRPRPRVLGPNWPRPTQRSRGFTPITTHGSRDISTREGCITTINSQRNSEIYRSVRNVISKVTGQTYYLSRSCYSPWVFNMTFLQKWSLVKYTIYNWPLTENSCRNVCVHKSMKETVQAIEGWGGLQQHGP